MLMYATVLNLTTLLEIAQFLSVDINELITDKKERNY